MNDSSSTQSDAFDRLKAANPFVDGDSSIPQPDRARAALFEETVMQTYEVSTAATERNQTPSQFSKGAGPARRSSWRRLLAAPVLAGLACLTLVGVIIGIGTLGGAPTALASVTEAAERTDATRSGVITITIDGTMQSEPNELPESRSFVSQYRYENDDYEFSLRTDGAVDDEVEDRTELFVDGVHYEKDEGDTEFRYAPNPGEYSLAAQLGINPESISAESLIPLVSASGDFAEVLDADVAENERLFRGSVSREIFLTLDPEQVPAGVSILGEEDPEQFPPFVQIEALLRDDLMRTVTVAFAGDTSDGIIDFLITTEFSEFGRPQNLRAPGSPEQPFTDEELREFMTEEEFAERQSAIAMLEDLEQRRPGLCADLSPANFVALNTPEEVRAAQMAYEAYFECLVDEGEPEVATALRALNADFLSADPQGMEGNSALEDLYERRPDLCAESRPRIPDSAPDSYRPPDEEFEALAVCLEEAGEPAAAVGVRNAKMGG